MFSLCQSLFLTLFLLFLPYYAFLLQWHRLSLGHIPFDLPLSTSCCCDLAQVFCVSTPDISCCIFSFFFLTPGALHMFLVVPKKRSICPSEAEGHQKKPIPSALSGNTKYELTVTVSENQYSHINRKRW